MKDENNIAGMTREEILMKIHDHGVAARVMEWAEAHDAYYAGVLRALRGVQSLSEKSEMIAALIVETHRLREQLYQVYASLRPPDVVMDGTRFSYVGPHPPSAE